MPSDRDRPIDKRTRAGEDDDSGGKRSKPGPDARVVTPTASLPAASPSAASSVGSGHDRAAAAAPIADKVRETPLPRIRDEWELTGFPPARPHDVAPALAAAQAAADASDTPFFGPEHQLVLAQLVDAAAVTAKKRGTGRLTILDLGAGLGSTTRFCLEAVRKHSLLPTVFAVDVWHAPYAGALLGSHGNRQLSKAMWALADSSSSSSSSSSASSEPSSKPRPGAGPTFYHAFCRELWDAREDVVPVRGLLPRALRRLRGDGVEPDVVFVDAELDRRRLRRLLRAVIDLFPGAAICGGGWAQSQGVQLAVADIVRAVKLARQAQSAQALAAPSSSSSSADAGMTSVSPASASAPELASHPCPHIPAQLHVERGRAWTIAGGLIRATRNKEGAAPSLAASRVAAEDVEEAVSAEAWLGRVVQLTNVGDDGAKVWALCKNHGRTRAQAKAAEAVTAAGPLPGEDASRVWIDHVQSGAKRQLTALMWAAKQGRRDITRALLAAGARINVQSDRSRYSALIMAAFGGHDHIVRLLLRAGARLDLKNKFGETAEQTARKPIVKSLLAGVRKLGDSPSASAVARVVGQSTHDKPEDMHRDNMALLGLYQP